MFKDNPSKAPEPQSGQFHSDDEWLTTRQSPRSFDSISTDGFHLTLNAKTIVKNYFESIEICPQAMLESVSESCCIVSSLELFAGALDGNVGRSNLCLLP